MNRHAQTKRKTDRQCNSTGWQADKQKDVQIDKCSHIHNYSTKDRQTDNQTGQTDKKDKQTNR
jgi:hypothetical protein